MAYKRYDLEVEEVSFVDRPAVPQAKIFFTKRQEPGRKVSILKMNGGKEVAKTGTKEGFKKAFLAAKEKFQKAVRTITETLEAEMHEDQFWDQIYDVMSAWWDVLYDLMEDDSITDKTAALNDLIDELGMKLKEATGILSGTAKGANMEQGNVLKAVEGLGAKLDGLGKRIEALENKGKETTEKATEVRTGQLAPEDPVAKALDGINGKLDAFDKRLAVLESKPEPSTALKGQEGAAGGEDAKWPSFAVKG